MKRFGFILIILLFGLFIIDNSDDNSETIELSESVENEKDSIYNFYENFPKEIIPLQIPYTDYILEARIISLNATIKQNAFISSKDEYTVGTTYDGLSLTVQFSIKNSNNFDMWIPLERLQLTSKEFALEDDKRINNIHPNKEYNSSNPVILYSEPKWKINNWNHILYFLTAKDSLILETNFKLIPKVENVIICGLSIYSKNGTYEKGIEINLTQNAIVDTQIFHNLR